MKPFNLEEALKGEPVKLRDGSKAFLFCDVTKLAKKIKVDFPILGVYLNDGACDCEVKEDYWDIDGNYTTIDECNPKDVIGMWEEPELTQEQILEKAYSENLRITFDATMFIDGYDVIAKTKDNKYVIEHGATLRIVKPPIKGLAIYTSPKPPTVTVTLPRPFSPKIGDCFYYIYSNVISGELNISSGKFGKTNKQAGNKFRTLDDAKAWIDAMNGALDE